MHKCTARERDSFEDLPGPLRVSFDTHQTQGVTFQVMTVPLKTYFPAPAFPEKL